MCDECRDVPWCLVKLKLVITLVKVKFGEDRGSIKVIHELIDSGGWMPLPFNCCIGTPHVYTYANFSWYFLGIHTTGETHGVGPVIGFLTLRYWSACSCASKSLCTWNRMCCCIWATGRIVSSMCSRTLMPFSLPKWVKWSLYSLMACPASPLSMLFTIDISWSWSHVSQESRDAQPFLTTMIIAVHTRFSCTGGEQWTPQVQMIV